MKLGPLRAAIRSADSAAVDIFGMQVLVQKTALLKALGEKFPEGKGQETGLAVGHENGVTVLVAGDRAGSEDVDLIGTGAPGAAPEDDDLLGDLL